MSDLISRQAAIDEFYKHPNIRWTTLDVMEKIDKVPSAQPEIIRCKECAIRYDSCPMVVRIGNNVEFFAEDNDFCSRGRRKGEEE